MTPSSAQLHSALRDVTENVQAFIRQLPSKPTKGSQCRNESEELRRTSGGGGRTRADLIGRITQDAGFKLSHSLFFVEGIADLFDSAHRNVNLGVNYPSVATLARSAVEALSLIPWLLDDQLNSSERCRRYFILIFNDLREKRMAIGEPFDRLIDEYDEAIRRFEVETATWEQRCREAGWGAVPYQTVGSGGNFRGPALLQVGSSDKAEAMPSRSALVARLLDTHVLYQHLSMEAHGSLFGIRESVLETDEGASDGRYVMTGTLKPQYSLRAVLLGLTNGIRSTAEWHGASWDDLAARLRQFWSALPPVT